MTGEHGGCCCNHDDLGQDHDQKDKAVQSSQTVTVTEAASCCSGACNHEGAFRSNDHASTAVRSSS